VRRRAGLAPGRLRSIASSQLCLLLYMTSKIWCRLFAALGLLIAAGCAGVNSSEVWPPPRTTVSVPTPTAPRPNSPATAATDAPCIQTSHGCVALNPDVTEETVRQTICIAGYAKSVRPSSSYTNAVKAKLLRDAGLDASRMLDFELDHIVPLALGGHPRKLANLALQPWDGEHGAERKDALEIRMHSLVCREEVSLNEAQVCIAEDWEACAAKYMTR